MLTNWHVSLTLFHKPSPPSCTNEPSSLPLQLLSYMLQRLTEQIQHIDATEPSVGS